MAFYIPRTYEVINYYTRLKAALIKAGDVSITAVHHEVASGVEYRAEYSFADCDIKLAFEDSTKIDADEFDKFFSRPVIIIYAEETSSLITAGTMTVEFNILVNTQRGGRITLDGLTQLCQVLLNREEYGGFWAEFGLLPHDVTITEIVDGSEIDPDLTNRLLIRSVLARFSKIGATYGTR